MTHQANYSGGHRRGNIPRGSESSSELPGGQWRSNEKQDGALQGNGAYRVKDDGGTTRTIYTPKPFAINNKNNWTSVQEVIGTYLTQIGPDKVLGQAMFMTVFSSRMVEPDEAHLFEGLSVHNDENGVQTVVEDGDDDEGDGLRYKTVSIKIEPKTGSTSSSQDGGDSSEGTEDKPKLSSSTSSSSNQVEVGEKKADDSAARKGVKMKPPMPFDIEDRKFYGTGVKYIVFCYKTRSWVQERPSISQLRKTLAEFLRACIRGTNLKHISQMSVECREDFSYLYNAIKEHYSGNAKLNAQNAFKTLAEVLIKYDPNMHWSLIWSNMIEQNRIFQEVWGKAEIKGALQFSRDTLSFFFMQQTIEECPYRTEIQNMLIAEPDMTPEAVIAFIKRREISDKAMKKPPEAIYSNASPKKYPELAYARANRQDEDQHAKNRAPRDTKGGQNKSPRPCWQFKTTVGCKFGDECRFSHDPNAVDGNARRAQESEEDEEGAPEQHSDEENEGAVRKVSGQKTPFLCYTCGADGHNSFQCTRTFLLCWMQVKYS
jgi:hypothetical protein